MWGKVKGGKWNPNMLGAQEYDAVKIAVNMAVLWGMIFYF
jgi:hypothetical protein